MLTIGLLSAGVSGLVEQRFDAEVKHTDQQVRRWWHQQHRKPHQVRSCQGPVVYSMCSDLLGAHRLYLSRDEAGSLCYLSQVRDGLADMEL